MSSISFLFINLSGSYILVFYCIKNLSKFIYSPFSETVSIKMELLSSDKFKGNIYTRGGEAEGGGQGGTLPPPFQVPLKFPFFLYTKGTRFYFR